MCTAVLGMDRAPRARREAQGASISGRAVAVAMNEGQLMVFPAPATCMGGGQVRAPLVRGTISIILAQEMIVLSRESESRLCTYVLGDSTTDAGRVQPTIVTQGRAKAQGPRP